MQHAMETGKENGEVPTEDKDEKEEIPVVTEASSPMEDQNASVKDDASNDQGDSKKAPDPTETDLQSPTSPVAEEPEIPVMNGGNHHNEEEIDTNNDVDNDNKSEAMSVTSP